MSAPAFPVPELDPAHPTLVFRDYWMAALKFYATGRTAEGLRVQAADPAWTAGLAFIDGVTPAEEAAELLAIAGAIDSLAVAGLTPERAYALAGLDKVLGPYAENSALSAEVAA